MVKTPDGHCAQLRRPCQGRCLDWQLRQLPGVESTNSLAALSAACSVGLQRRQPQVVRAVPNAGMLNSVTDPCAARAVQRRLQPAHAYVYLTDHKAETLTRVVDDVEAFARHNNTDEAQFLLAAGNAGIEAATNIVVKQASARDAVAGSTAP